MLPKKKFKNLDILSMFLRHSEVIIKAHSLHSLGDKYPCEMWKFSSGQGALLLHPGNTACKIPKPYELDDQDSGTSLHDCCCFCPLAWKNQAGIAVT